MDPLDLDRQSLGVSLPQGIQVVVETPQGAVEGNSCYACVYMVTSTEQIHVMIAK